VAAPIVADWRDRGAYAALLAGDRSCFAWEWLRRSDDYAGAWAAGDSGPDRFGLLCFENPACDALVSRPLWRADTDRAVLVGEARPLKGGSGFDLASVAALATILPGDTDTGVAEHALLSDGLRSIRIDLLSGTLAAGPVALRWRIDGLAEARPQLLALRRLSALARHGRFAASLHLSERRARRWVQMLGVHDALAAGATHREIAAMLFDVDVAGPRWRVRAAPWRLRVQRLAAGARACQALGPAGWLGGEVE
jgi:hypothetical protein